MKFSVGDILKVIDAEDLLLEVDLSKLNPDELLTAQGVDSLDLASILFGIENYYGVKINNETVAAGEWTTINKILMSMERLIN